MTRPLHIPLVSGLPDAGAPGQWLGRDRHGAVYILRWMPEKQCWGALGWRANHPKPWPELVLLQGEQEGFIRGHVEGSAIEPSRPRMRGNAPRIIIHDEVHDWPARQVAGWTPWIWTLAMLFGLPAAALAIVFLAAQTPKADCKPATAGAAGEPVTCRSAP